MIVTFQSISLFGTGDPKLMAGGISQALVTTVMGLVTAIPLLFLHTLMASRSRTLIQILDEQSAGVIAAQANQHD
jgi:biopolymer transport protein ExbB